MYAGFITPKRVVKSAGIHQRLDSAAYRMISHYLPDEAFPELKAILAFEGYNGPDGLNTKLGLKPKSSDPSAAGEHGPSHLYDPVTDSGEVPQHIATHYRGLVESLGRSDMIRASFEAAWLAHYVGDGLTPGLHDALRLSPGRISVQVRDDDSSPFPGEINPKVDRRKRDSIRSYPPTAGGR